MTEPGEIFASTAPYYARYRQPYDRRAFAAIATAFGLGADSTVLDLGTGTGHVALGLAPLVGRVVAVDPSADMLAVARAADGPANVTWRLGDSTRLAELGLERLDAVTMGRSFHWMDRPAVLADLDRLVVPHGGIALLRTLERRTPGDPATAAWIDVVREVVARYGLAPDHVTRRTDEHVEVLRASPFSRVEVLTFDGGDVTLTLDEVVCGQFSYSYTSPARLGERRDAFEADLRAALLAHDPAGRYRLGPVTTEVALAIRPRAVQP